MHELVSASAAAVQFLKGISIAVVFIAVYWYWRWVPQPTPSDSHSRWLDVQEKRCHLMRGQGALGNLLRKLLNFRSTKTQNSAEITVFVPFSKPQAIALIERDEDFSTITGSYYCRELLGYGNHVEIGIDH
jgi:hypothetical protein